MNKKIIIIGSFLFFIGLIGTVITLSNIPKDNFVELFNSGIFENEFNISLEKGLKGWGLEINKQ